MARFAGNAWEKARLFSGRFFGRVPEVSKVEGVSGFTYEESAHPSGSVGSARKWTKKARIKSAQLPHKGKIRFLPPKGYHPNIPLQCGPEGLGYRDKFGNIWLKGPSRTTGEEFEWDVQFSPLGKQQLGWASRDGLHLNVSLYGRITH